MVDLEKNALLGVEKSLHTRGLIPILNIFFLIVFLFSYYIEVDFCSLSHNYGFNAPLLL